MRPYNHTFGQVIYNVKRQEKFIQEIADENANKLEKLFQAESRQDINNENEIESIYFAIAHAAIELCTNYSLQFPFYKNPNFVEEKEWRIVLLAYPYWKSEMINGNFRFRAPKFRMREGEIISYIEMDFSQIKQDFIREIWIGPKSRITADDVLDLLHAMGYYAEGVGRSAENPIPILYSSSSYR